MLIADRYPAERRGAAVGWLIASSSAGYALSLLLAAPSLAWGGYETAFVVSACGPLVGVVVLWLALRTTPNVVHPRRPGVRFGSAVLRNRPAIRLILGYTFHSWELLGMWAWTPAFVAAVFAATGAATIRSVELAGYLSAAFHLTGLVASSSMGRLSDHLGRRIVLFVLAATSAACSLAFGWLIAAPVAIVFVVGALYGFTALGDSPVLSTALTETVGASHLGSALALRSFLGFGAGAIAPIVFGRILDLTNAPGPAPVVWGWAFVALGGGGLLAAYCAWGLAPDWLRAVRAKAPSM
jgi:MFS family permease